MKFISKRFNQPILKFAFFPFTNHKKSEITGMYLAWRKKIIVHSCGNNEDFFRLNTVSNEILSSPGRWCPYIISRETKFSLRNWKPGSFPHIPTRGSLWMGCTTRNHNPEVSIKLFSPQQSQQLPIYRLSQFRTTTRPVIHMGELFHCF